MEGVPGLTQLLSQPGPGLLVLGQHSHQSLHRGEWAPHQSHGTTVPLAGFILPHPSLRANRRAWGAARQSCQPSL